MVDRRAFRTSHPRHARTRLAAVLLCAGLGVTSAPHAMAAPNDDPNSVASLANDLTQAQKKLAELQNEQGGIRQEANKTVYELDEATSDANDAQEKVVQARARLDKSQKDVEEAKDKLNSLSRSQYTQGQDSNAVTMAAGEDAVANTLDRASYLRTEAAKQRKVVSQLDKVRTQAANEESSLRKLLADASAKRKDAKESKDKALEAIQKASRKAADLQKSIQEAEARKNEIQSRLDEIKGDKTGSSINSPAAPAQNNASDTSVAGPSTSASATQDNKPASDSAPSADNAADNQDNSSDSASSDDQLSTSSAPTTEQLAYDTANDADAGTGEPTQESTEPSSDATASASDQSSSDEPATASSEDSAQDQQDSAQNDQADSSSNADNADDQGAKADQGIDYAAADQTEKERSEAAADAKQKADNALAAAKDAKEKEDNGDPTVEQARQNAANLATIASEAVKRVEELTEKLRQILGAAFDSSSNDADKALIGLTSSGLAALAAGLKAGQEGNDPVAAALNGGRQAARQAWNQIQNQSDNSGNTGSTNTGSGSASTATGTTGSGTGSDNSGSTTSGSSTTGSDNSSNDQSGSSTSSGNTGSTSTDTNSDGSDSDDESTSTTSQLVNGLKNNSDALNRVTDGTDQASLATSIGGGNSANSSTTGTTNTGDNAQTATSGSAETRINAVIARAQSQLGVRYSWGGGNYYGPTVGIRDGGVADQYGDYAHAGFDCSGLVLYAFYIAGFKLPHYTGAQYQSGTQYPASQMKRGDLIFYGPNASQHVAIYLGNDQMIEAPESGSVVKISPVRYGGMTPNVVRLIS